MTVKKLNKRWWFWLPLLGSAAWLAVFGDKTPANTVALPAPSKVSFQSPGSKSATPAASGAEKTVSSGKPRPNAAQSSKSLEALVPRDQLIPGPQTRPQQARDLFASGSWMPPPPLVKPLPPPPPVAPALPFTFLGKKLEGKVWEVFLARGEQSFIVREGTVLENTYRVETISPPNLNLTYLPLGQSQSLLIGDSQ